jgi:type II secretory pathway pseudopilin PulG
MNNKKNIKFIDKIKKLESLKCKSGAGFTLFETIIYIGIAGIMLVSFVQFSLIVSGSRNKNYAAQEVQANTRTALDIITQKIRLADDVNAVAGPIEGNSDTTLTLDMPGGGTTVFSIQGTSLSINEGSEVSLTSNNVNVTSLNFTNLAQSEERDNIKVEFTIEYANPGDVRFTSTQTIQTTVSLRK